MTNTHNQQMMLERRVAEQGQRIRDLERALVNCIEVAGTGNARTRVCRVGAKAKPTGPMKGLRDRLPDVWKRIQRNAQDTAIGESLSREASRGQAH